MLLLAINCGWYEWLNVSWAQGSKCYRELWTIDDMNDFGLWGKGFRCYELFKVMDDMNDSGSWPKGSRCYEKLWVMDNTKDSRFRELRVLDGMNNFRSWMTWRTLGRELKAIDVMNCSGQLMIRMIWGHELRSLVSVNSSSLWMIWMTLGCELRALDAMNNSR